MADVIPLGGITTLDIPVDSVLDGAKEHDLEHILLIGKCSTGEFYFAANHSDGADLMWMLEICKKAILDALDEY